MDKDIHNFAFHMPKLFVPANFSTSNLALETIVVTGKGFVEDSDKAFPEESTEDFVEELLDIFLPIIRFMNQSPKSPKRTNPNA